jgi:uncharacterized YceG family protein
LTPDDPKPPTDEFGRDDPDTVERELRRREREERRRGAREELGSKVGRGRKAKPPKPAKAAKTAKAPRAARPPKAREPSPPAPPTDEAPRQPAGGGPSGNGTYHRRRFVALAGALIGLLLVWFLIALFQPFAGDGQGSGRVAVEIPRGASAGEVANLLADKGVVSNSKLFEIRLKLSGKSGNLISGPLAMASGMSYGAALDRLTGETQETGTLVIPEGYSRDQIAPLLSKAGITGDYLAASTSSPGFNPAQYGAKNPPNLEGFLFPATYDVKPGETAQDLVAEQLVALRQNLAKVDLTYAKKKNLTVYDVLTIASMIDREVQVPKERALVAAVIYNRLHGNMPLGIDATTRYQFHNYTQPLTNTQLNSSSPYNTRTNAGLTPTPIGNPGLAAIKAAAQPAKVNYLYYVVKPGTCGEHSFTADQKQFNALARQYQQALQEQGGSPTKC